MNKKLLFLLPILVTLGLTACGANESIQADARSVDETWRKNVASIKKSDVKNKQRYYSNEPGDYINDVHITSTILKGTYKIEWSSNFYPWDDLQSYFEYDNGYKTDVETTHTKFGSDYITISDSIVDQYKLWEATIVAVWVRTVD